MITTGLLGEILLVIRHHKIWNMNHHQPKFTFFGGKFKEFDMEFTLIFLVVCDLTHHFWRRFSSPWTSKQVKKSEIDVPSFSTSSALTATTYRLPKPSRTRSHFSHTLVLLVLDQGQSNQWHGMDLMLECLLLLFSSQNRTKFSVLFLRH